jgi:hypothetical protein
VDYEALVQTVTREVLRRLQDGQPVKPEGGQLLAVFTGGVIGLEQALAELKRLKTDGARFTVVLSQAAEQVIGVERIQTALGNDVEIVYSHSPYPGRQLQEAKGVLVPVLTRNTAAKLAVTLADTMVATLIFQALMLGKPVLAARDAADPQKVWRVGNPAAKAPPGLMNALEANLKKLESLGMRLLPVERLAGEAASLVLKEEQPTQHKPAAKRGVLNAETIKAAAAQGNRKLWIAPGTLVTPLARDLAHEYGVELEEQLT